MDAGPAAHLLPDPGEVLVGGARVDDEEIVVGAKAVDENVVDDAPEGVSRAE
jgi:hypothetical protein